MKGLLKIVAGLLFAGLVLVSCKDKTENEDALEPGTENVNATDGASDGDKGYNSPIATDNDTITANDEPGN
ncbi:MAG TPA: hypothetical protein VEA37_05240 [Flavobacterium sp.]|nr:hypothetical protein [Flavobacterium sp.]